MQAGETDKALETWQALKARSDISKNGIVF
jgi:hypothetical protein